MTGERCIWCGRVDRAARPEHIIPECLGCPSNAILRDGQVCSRCNNVLSRRDNALCDGFDLLRLAFGQPSKRREPPNVASRPNARTVTQNRERSFQINFGPGDQTTPTGHRLKAPAKDVASIHGELTVDGDIATATYRAHMFYQRDFTRGIYKIAVEAIALFLGSDAAQDKTLDFVRASVLDDSILAPRCLIGLNEKAFDTPGFSNQLFPPYRANDGSSGYVVPIRLFNLEFSADCTEGQQFIEYMISLRDFSPSAHTWRILPWERDPLLTE
jgi:hypothetical protein